MSFPGNSELCDALKNLIKIVPPKAGSVSAEGRKSLLTVKRICPIHAEPVHFFCPFLYKRFKIFPFFNYACFHFFTKEV
jgi:hypothetical protein